MFSVRIEAKRNENVINVIFCNFIVGLRIENNVCEGVAKRLAVVTKNSEGSLIMLYISMHFKHYHHTAL